MDLSQLEAFAHTCREGSFTRAAEGLFISQPALHRKVRQLEAELGASLLVVRNRRVVPTAAGERLLQTAELILTELADLRTSLVGTMPTIHVGAVSLIAATVVPEAIARFEAAHAQPRIALQGLDADQLTEGLLSGRLDLGVTYLSYVSPDLEADLLCEVDTVCAVGRKHPLADGKCHSLQEVLIHPLALTHSGMGLRTSVENLFREHEGIEELPVAFEAKFGALLAQYAASSNMHVTFLPRPAVRHFGLSLVELDVPPIKSTIVICRVRGSRRTPAVDEFCGILHEQARLDPDVTS
ncbi:MAG: LysR family transcriptional regulator [Dehalococcoidia bacterium]